MPKVYKYEIPLKDDFELELPREAEILSFQCQHDAPCIWVLVEPRNPPVKRRFRFAGTGHDIKQDPKGLKFIGTAQMHGGSLIWHLFEVIRG